MIESSELGEALNNLLVVTHALKIENLHGELLLTKSRYSENKSNRRKGIVRQDEYDLENNKIRNNVLEIYNEMEEMPDINRNLRFEMKRIIMAQEKYFEGIIVEYSKMTKGVIGKIEFPPKDFKDIGDFLNAVYLEMYKFIPPFTYGKTWVLLDYNNKPINYTPIQEPSSKKDEKGLEILFPHLNWQRVLYVEPLLSQSL